MASGRPARAVVVILAAFIIQAVSMVGWSMAFHQMSNWAILASLSIGPLLGIFFFVHRFVVFRFWEDLLFAVSVALAYAPFLLQAWDFTWLSFLALLLVILGAACLHIRWVTWTRSLADMGSEDATDGVQT